jgi:hypothetical protein
MAGTQAMLWSDGAIGRFASRLFEGCGPQCVLMGMIDDATNRVWGAILRNGNTHASYDMVEGWAKRYGLPQSLYVDRDSIYRYAGLGTVEEQLAGKAPQTQFGRAMEQLGVELIDLKNLI